MAENKIVIAVFRGDSFFHYKANEQIFTSIVGQGACGGEGRGREWCIIKSSSNLPAALT